MTLYRVPNHTANWRTFRILGWGAIILLFGICILSIYEPLELTELARRVLAWTAGVIVLSVVVIAFVLSSREGSRELKDRLEFEVADGKIIQRCEGQQAVEVLLDQIESLLEDRGWLVIQGAQPARQITIPAEVNGFEALKRELTAHHALTRLGTKTRLLRLLPLVLLIAACFFLFISRNSAIVLVAGGVVLLLQGLGLYSIWRLRRNALRRKLLLLTEVLLWLVTAWIVYERATGGL